MFKTQYRCEVINPLQPACEQSEKTLSFSFHVDDTEVKEWNGLDKEMPR